MTGIAKPFEEKRFHPARGVFDPGAGDVVFFHYLTLHGSMPNRSERTGKTVLSQLLSGRDALEPGCRHPDERMVPRGWNHAISREAAGRAG